MLNSQNLYLRSFEINQDIPADDYLSQLPVIAALEQIGTFSFSSPLTIFVGENGSGKSTLIEALAILMDLNAEGGSKHFNFKTDDTHSNLHKYIRVSKGVIPPHDRFFLRAESFYGMASYVDSIQAIHSLGNKSLHMQSHGESFMSLIENRFWGEGLYILDEPEAALSPQKTLQLMLKIHELLENNSQIIMATHSPLLLSITEADLYEIKQESITACAYYETDHFKLVKDFLNDPERMQYYLYK